MTTRWAISLALLLTATPLTLAAGVEHPGLLALAQRADEVIVGECVTVRCEWNERRTVIHTLATYVVRRTIKGQAGSERVTVRSLGGTVGRITQWAVGGPRFRVGQRDVLFLKRRPGDAYPLVYGLGAGQMPMRRDPRTGQWLVTSGWAGDAVPRPPSRGAGADSALARVTAAPMPIEAIEHLVRSAARAAPRQDEKR